MSAERFVILSPEGRYYECADGFGGAVWTKRSKDAQSWKHREHAEVFIYKQGLRRCAVVIRR